MARRFKPKPKTPEQIAAEKAARQLAERRQGFEAVGLQPDAATLIANAEIEVDREGRKNAERARRADWLDQLKPGMAPGCYDAARRLETDFRIRAGEGDAGLSLQRVDCTAGLTSDLMIAAGQRIEAVLRLMPLRDGLLFRSINQPKLDATWRDTVKRLTGEANPHAQAAVVRGACLNLRDAYQAMERRAA